MSTVKYIVEAFDGANLVESFSATSLDDFTVALPEFCERNSDYSIYGIRAGATISDLDIPQILSEIDNSPIRWVGNIPSVSFRLRIAT